MPHLPVDVQALGCDFYAFSGHKMLGPMGSGALWARRELLEAMPPFLSGGEMIREVHLRRSDFNDIPWKFEAGTPAVGDAIGLGVAVDYLEAIGMDAVRVHERELVAYGLDALPRGVPGIELYGPLDPDLRGGVIPFNLPGIHPHDVAQVLDRSGVAVRAGHHCTMPLHERLDLAATARASFSVYSTPEDIDALVAGLLEVQRVFNGLLMVALVNVVLALVLVTIVGSLVGYSIRKGQDVIDGIFGLPGQDRHEPRGIQERIPPPAWRFGRRRWWRSCHAACESARPSSLLASGDDLAHRRRDIILAERLETLDRARHVRHGSRSG